MSCPNCGQQLSGRHLDNQTVFHCRNCGGTFFDENGINRISLRSSIKMAADKKTEEISGGQKRCPKDGYRLAAILNDEAIPPDVTLLRCERCRGIFAYPDDLVQFKKAQGAKVDYYKMWQTPLSSLKSVIVLTFVLIISAGIYFSYGALQDNTSRQLQAADLIRNTSISAKGRFLFMTFRTQVPARSQIILQNKTTGELYVRNIADSFTRTHVFTTTELNLSDEITYQIVLYTKGGSIVKSSVRNLVVNK